MYKWNYQCVMSDLFRWQIWTGWCSTGITRTYCEYHLRYQRVLPIQLAYMERVIYRIYLHFTCTWLHHICIVGACPTVCFKVPGLNPRKNKFSNFFFDTLEHRCIDSLIYSLGTSVQKMQKVTLSQERYSKIINLFWVSWQTGRVGKLFWLNLT